MADIRKGEDVEIELQNEYAYNSGLIWHSYKEYLDGIREPKMDYRIDGGSGMYGGGMFDSMYESASTYAMYAYLDSIGEKRCRWEIDRNSAYMDSGFIADVSFVSGSKKVSMLIDVSNAMYTVLDESIISDAGQDIMQKYVVYQQDNYVIVEYREDSEKFYYKERIPYGVPIDSAYLCTKDGKKARSENEAFLFLDFVGDREWDMVRCLRYLFTA